MNALRYWLIGGLLGLTGVTVGCGDDDGKEAEAEAEGEGEAEGEAEAEAESESEAESEGESAFHAVGSFNGDSFEMTCNYDGTDTVSGVNNCQKLQWFATCRPDGKALGELTKFQVWFYLPTVDGTVGAHDYLGTTNGIKMGDALGAPSAADSSNAEANTITVATAAAAGEPVDGMFTATWTDEGADYGTVSGGFHFPCTK